MEHENPRPRRHSKRIPEEVWNHHRQEITRLYQTMTMEQVMLHMRDRHNFTPTYDFFLIPPSPHLFLHALTLY